MRGVARRGAAGGRHTAALDVHRALRRDLAGVFGGLQLHRLAAAAGRGLVRVVEDEAGLQRVGWKSISVPSRNITALGRSGP